MGSRRIWAPEDTYPGPMAGVDLVDETYVVVERTRLAAVVADPARWQPKL